MKLERILSNFSDGSSLTRKKYSFPLTSSIIRLFVSFNLLAPKKPSIAVLLANFEGPLNFFISLFVSLGRLVTITISLLAVVKISILSNLIFLWLKKFEKIWYKIFFHSICDCGGISSP